MRSRQIQEEKERLAAHGQKRCGTCRQIHALGYFSTDSSRKDGLNNNCRSCCKRKHDDYYSRENAKVLAQKRIYSFRKKGVEINEDDFISLLVTQGPYCAICGNFIEGRDLNLDHDHRSGKLRGLLCNRCNMGLGYFRDDEGLLNKAAKYLEDNK